MGLPAAGVVVVAVAPVPVVVMTPRTTLFEADARRTPLRLFERAMAPVGSVPMKLPATVLFCPAVVEVCPAGTAPVRVTPLPPLAPITLPAPGSAPPTVLWLPARKTPSPPLPTDRP